MQPLLQKQKEKTKSGDNKNTETDTEKKDILDEIDDGDLILQDRRESVPLTPENAIFTRSQGGLISAYSLKHDDGKEDGIFRRVIVLLTHFR